MNYMKYLIVFSIALMSLICSCVNNNTNDEQPDTTEVTKQSANEPNSIRSINTLYCLRYDSSDFINMLKKANGYQKLLFKIYTPNLWETDVKLQLLAHPARNHAHYGR